MITMYHVENMPDDCLVLKREVDGNSDGTVQCALHAECADHAVPSRVSREHHIILNF